MKPSEDAQNVEPANVQSAAASTTPSTSTAAPPVSPSRPNQRGTLRASSAASEEPMITLDAHAALGAATWGERDASAAACSASNDAPPSTTIDAKNPSGSKRMIRAW